MKDLLNFILKDLVADSLALLQNDNIRIIFYKEEEKIEWHQKNIVLQEDNTISERDLKTLKWIKSVDKKAVVMKKRDFIKDWGTEFVPLEEMAGTIEYRYGRLDCHSNISKFLEQYAEEVQTLKFDKEKFLQSEMGSLLREYVEKLYMTEVEESNFNFLKYKELAEMILIALKQCYGVKYYILFTKHEYGVFSPDTNDWLYRR